MCSTRSSSSIYETCIQHLRSIGVNLIVLTDIGSIDGNADRLEKFAGDPDIRIIRIDRGSREDSRQNVSENNRGVRSGSCSVSRRG